MNGDNQEKPYMGLLGLDKLPPVIKALNFVVTVIIGAVVVWISTIRPTTSPTIRYEYWHLSLPLVFTYGLPVGLAC
ncbi:MAG: hypothetical protein L0287_26490 [Anaerolineae bacterium]|nr:hypothetical protein [Anaerolineae bacterium]MCI0609139.1 hypothetical protein [Anaerolineae bacterium]